MKRIRINNWKELKAGDLFLTECNGTKWIAKILSNPELHDDEARKKIYLTIQTLLCQNEESRLFREDYQDGSTDKYPIYLTEDWQGWKEFILNEKEQEKYGKMVLAGVLSRK